MTTGAAGDLLLAATALHAGFQLTVTVLVYPALVRTPADRWTEAHAAHSRRVTPVVALVYAVALAACVVGVAAGATPGTWVAVAGTAVALLVTAAVAGPVHGRLRTPDPLLLRRLLVADRVRCVASWAALAGALGAALV